MKQSLTKIYEYIKNATIGIIAICFVIFEFILTIAVEVGILILILKTIKL
jgi:hypothetical protein